MAKIRIGSVGATLKLRVRDDDGGLPINLSSASTKQIILVSPSGKSKTFSALFVTDGIDGRIKHVTQAGDLDESGTWIIYAHIVLPTLDASTSEHEFQVYGRR